MGVKSASRENHFVKKKAQNIVIPELLFLRFKNTVLLDDVLSGMYP